MSLERYLPGADIEDGGDDANPSDQETIDVSFFLSLQTSLSSDVAL